MDNFRRQSPLNAEAEPYVPGPTIIEPSHLSALEFPTDGFMPLVDTPDMETRLARLERYVFNPVSYVCQSLMPCAEHTTLYALSSRKSRERTRISDMTWIPWISGLRRCWTSSPPNSARLAETRQQPSISPLLPPVCLRQEWRCCLRSIRFGAIWPINQ